MPILTQGEMKFGEHILQSMGGTRRGSPKLYINIQGSCINSLATSESIFVGSQRPTQQPGLSLTGPSDMMSGFLSCVTVDTC